MGSWNEYARELLHLRVYHNGSYGVKYRRGREEYVIKRVQRKVIEQLYEKFIIE
jgi:hypothetical protein